MDKVIVASYMGSGSSAATDLLSEYSNVVCPHGTYEYVFLHCPGGLFDLEDKLLVGNNALRSDEALRAFEQTMQDLFDNDHWWFGGYRTKVSSQFMNHVGDFLSEISTASFSSFWYEQEKLGKSEWTANRIKKKLGARHYDLLATQLRMAYPTQEEFFEASRRFLEKTFADIAEGADDKTLVLDQLLLPHNLWRMSNYFDESDTRIIVISRDPRDVFALNKYVWSVQGDSIPVPLDVNQFCSYYRRMRNAERIVDSHSILRIRFEDLVLDYDETVASIEGFVGQRLLGNHENKLQRFNPSISKSNLGVFGFSADASHEAEIIAKELPEFLYPLDEATIASNTLDKAF